MLDYLRENCLDCKIEQCEIDTITNIEVKK
jgi:hypothetical protein